MESADLRRLEIEPVQVSEKRPCASRAAVPAEYEERPLEPKTQAVGGFECVGSARNGRRSDRARRARWAREVRACKRMRGGIMVNRGLRGRWGLAGGGGGGVADLE